MIKQSFLIGSLEKCVNMFKVNNEDSKVTSIDVVLVSVFVICQHIQRNIEQVNQ